MMARVVSINVSNGGVPKQPRETAMIRQTGVDGDRQNDLRYHGGPDRAVSLFSSDLIQNLRADGHPIVPGSIGENLTIEGAHWNDFVPGARVRAGQAELLVTSYAHPCKKIAASFRDNISTHVSQKVHPGRSRVYARVEGEGAVRLGDSVEVTQDYVVRLRESLDRAEPALAALDEAVTSRRPAPGKWSPREIIGHLIDSASNNHQRFVRAWIDNRGTFDGYDQERWVEAQQYGDARWTELVTLWALYNRQLARVMLATPADVRHRDRQSNFVALAFDAATVEATPTLDAFMRDYVNHLRHHVRQILGDIEG